MEQISKKSDNFSDLFIPMVTAQNFIQELQCRLKFSLPGLEAHDRLRTKPRDTTIFPNRDKDAIDSAVLILLFPDNEDFHFILTGRTETVEHHKGQISLPGGVRENQETLVTTALRETEEEIGVQRKDIAILGELTPLHTLVSGFMIHPFVGSLENRPEPNPHVEEVSSVHSVSLSELLEDSRTVSEKRTFNGIPVEVPFYQFDSVQVWGATSMILSEFKEIVKQVLNGQNRN